MEREVNARHDRPALLTRMLKLLRRRAFIVAAILFAILAGLDAWLKATPDPGYCPENAFCTLAADDFPSFYAALWSCDLSEAVSPEIHGPLADVSRGIRLGTGIRPTPIRWRVWLGSKFVAAYSEDGSGICVHPGLLLRLADVYRRVVQRVPEEEGVRRFGSLFYGWRDGFVVVSASRSYVQSSLAAPAPVLEPSRGRDEMRITWPGSEGVLRIRARDGLPAEGWFRGSLTQRTSPLTLAGAWPRPPLFAISASRWTDLKTLIVEAGNALQFAARGILDEETRGQVFAAGTQLAGYTSAQFRSDRLAKGWDLSADECAAALWDLDTDETTPVPELAFVFRGEGPAFGAHPLDKALPREDAIPHEWEGRPGIVIPWLGEKLMLCLAGRDRDWLLTTREPLMAELIGAQAAGPPIYADAALTLDWSKAGRCAATLVQKASDLELIPRMNRKDVEREWMPYVRAATRLGSLHLYGTARDGRVVFKGLLAQQKVGEGTD